RIPTGTAHLPQDQITRTTDRPVSSVVRSDAFVHEALRWISDTGSLVEAFEAADPAIKQFTSPQPKKRIVVAEDNADMRAYVCKLLAESHEVIGVGDGQQAL